MTNQSVVPNSMTVFLPLLQESLAEQQHFRMPLRGTSMRPTLPPACEIEIAPLTANTPLGSLIVFASGDTLIVHRLVRRSMGMWITQGDGRLGADAPVAPNMVLGIVSAAYTPDGRRCWPHRSSALTSVWWVGRHHLLRPLRWVWRRRAWLLLRLAPRGQR